MIGIYKITNPKGKIYVGQSVEIEKRFLSYKKLNCKQQLKIYASLIKYGIEKHSFEIICECDVSELNDKERYYQDLYSVIMNGLNLKLTKSEDRSGFLSQEIRDKISYSNKGKIRSDEYKRKLSEKLKGRPPCNKGVKMKECQRLKLSKIHSGSKRKPLSEETKIKISLSQKGIPRKKHSAETKLKISLASKGNKGSQARSLTIIDLNTGVFYDSITDYCNIHGQSHSKVYAILTGSRINKNFNNLKII